jgi:hypothetical protein
LATGDWDAAAALVTDVRRDPDRPHPTWAARCHAADGNYNRYLNDLTRIWRHAEEQGQAAHALRCALIASSVQELSNPLPAELVVGLMVTDTPPGAWSLPAVLDALRRQPPETRPRLIQALFDHGAPIPLDALIDLALNLDDPDERAHLLAMLAPRVSDDQIAA